MDLGDRRDKIDHDGPTFVWEQVAEDLAELIASGELAPGTKLPGERDLHGVWGVARVTMRRAIEELARRGLVVSVHGRGTFVARKTGDDAEA